MSGHQPFSQLTADFFPSRKAKIAVHKEQLKSEMALNEICHAVSLTQDELASKLNVKQPAISQRTSHHRLCIAMEKFWSLRDFLIPTVPMSDYWTLNFISSVMTI
jgi:hypothetical protein